jgi:hypothetical protein
MDRRRAFRRFRTAALFFACPHGQAHAQSPPSAGELAKRTILRRAVEAVIWGIPDVEEVK